MDTPARLLWPMITYRIDSTGRHRAGQLNEFTCIGRNQVFYRRLACSTEGKVNSGFGFVFRSHNNSVSFATAPQIKYSVCIFPF